VDSPQLLQIIELLLKHFYVAGLGLVRKFFLELLPELAVSHEDSNEFRNVALDRPTVQSRFSLNVLGRKEWGV